MAGRACVVCAVCGAWSWQLTKCSEQNVRMYVRAYVFITHKVHYVGVLGVPHSALYSALRKEEEK